MHKFTGQLGTLPSSLGNIELGVKPYVLNPLSNSVFDTLVLNQHITLNRAYNITISDSLLLAQNVDLDVRSHIIYDIHDRCIDDNLIFSEAITLAISHVHIFSISQTLGLTEPCILIDNTHQPETHYRSFSHNLLLSQAIHNFKGLEYTQNINQTLSLSQNISQYTLPNIFSISETIPFSESITKTFGSVLSQSVAQSLTFTEIVTPVHVISHHIVSRELYQVLALTQALSKSKLFVIRIPQHVDINDTLIKNNVFNFVLQDSLIFSNDRSLALNARTILKVPNISFVRVSKKVQPVTYLSGIYSDIYLPQPNYDDSETLNHVLNVNRSMTGIPYTYIKKSHSRTLTYSFSVNRLKAQELGSFYLKNAADPVKLVTYDDKHYIGFLTSEPLILTQSRTNVNDVELTFEGIPM